MIDGRFDAPKWEKLRRKASEGELDASIRTGDVFACYLVDEPRDLAAWDSRSGAAPGEPHGE